MRKELRELVEGGYWVYGPAVHEFHFVIDMIQKYSDYADESVGRDLETLSKETEFIDEANEISSDRAYYNYIEKGLLWSFALWRIQGLFEALLINRFLPEKPKRPLIGFKSKLSAISSAGYSICEGHEQELNQWAALRNLLSHAPPEHFSPIAVDRQDAEKYVELLVAVCSSLEEQREAVFKMSSTTRSRPTGLTGPGLSSLGRTTGGSA